MWVNEILSGRVRKIALFVIIVALVTLILYAVSYESWMNGSLSEKMATSTPEVSSSTELVSSTTPTEKKPISMLKTITPLKSTMTTIFWVGEPADSDNAYITNTESYWDEKWQEHYGGVDDPNCRTGYLPCSFTPKENPFYFALPYAEYDENGDLKTTAKEVPWYAKGSTLLKNRWIEVRHGEYTCYAQWEDVGPNGEDDFSYVFGKTKPVNTFGEKAGLDSSPALWKCLHMSDNDITQWAFVDASDVPSGPWKDIVTTSGISWGN